MTMEAVDHLDLAGRVSVLPAPVPLRLAVDSLVARQASIRQERLSGIHNPWGHGAGLTDPWAFLALCESDLVIDAARALLGPDIILWDSELFGETSGYAAFLHEGREGRYWPVTPIAGALVLVAVGRERPHARALGLEAISAQALADFDPREPLYVIRLMPATSRFERDAAHPAHRACMEEQVLINYANRPLWLVSGADRAGNDLVTGFCLPVPAWASAAQRSE
ncbi:resolvase [Labrys sp. ZIDIC5]|uniref:resolvase n=1 Tax=Labrys sedimenti TaxID=3106036 RepID=UPI002ACACD9D|nr:resolvase [Labrys sp. ZIDIC5]MDZ5454363.1 resolvase [Labrys sp. ZIDIC5]